MRLNRSALLVAFAALIAATVVVVSLASRRDSGVATASPVPSSTAIATATAAVTPVVTPSPTPTALPVADGRYVSAGLGYSIVLPPPWHRASCSGVDTQQTPVRGGEEFWSVSVRDETGTDTGVAYPTVRVLAEPNPENLSPRQWVEQGRFPGGTVGQVQDVVYADRPAARRTEAGTLPAYFVANAGRMYTVWPAFRTPPDAATQQAMNLITESFRFLTEAQQAAARAALPTAAPSRTPEQVADAVAAAFTAKDSGALAAFLAPCVSTAGENAGVSFVSREKYVEDLRGAFAAGLTVTVRPRPFEGDRATGGLTVTSTWQDSRGIKERRLMLRRGENDRWEWHGTIERF